MVIVINVDAAIIVSMGMGPGNLVMVTHNNQVWLTFEI